MLFMYQLSGQQKFDIIGEAVQNVAVCKYLSCII